MSSLLSNVLKSGQARGEAALISGISFLGSRTAAVDEMTLLYSQVFGLQLRHRDSDFVAFEALNGDRIELFGLGHKHHHFSTGPVGGFEVDDIAQGLVVLRSAGLELLSGVDGHPGGTQWIHYRAPDGNVYELVHHAERHSPSGESNRTE